MIFPTTTKGMVAKGKVLKDNIDFVKQLNPTSVVISPLGAFYGAEVFQNKKAYGITVGKDFDTVMPHFEFSTYLPKQFWKLLEYKIENMNFEQILKEVKKFTMSVNELGIPTDITDEQVILARGSGFMGYEGLMDFYTKTVHDIVSCSNENLKKIYKYFNKASQKIAMENLKAL